MRKAFLIGALLLAGLFLSFGQEPLYVDPELGGSTDPMVCFNPVTGTYYMYYTSRRSLVRGLRGIESVHGSPIGVAESRDGGATWTFIGNADIDYHPDPDPTYWAPEVIWHEGLFHMYLTYVPGIFNDWNHPRDIVHLTSPDGLHWSSQSVLDLAVRKVIDACVFQLPDGTWRLWYNNETDGKSIYFADSPDLYHWTDRGKVPIETVGEGPNVFLWKGRYYMIVDEWKGISVFSSEDLLNWTKQDGDYLVAGGEGVPPGNHADVEVIGDHAYMFYFRPRRPGYAVYVAELQLDADGRVVCDEQAPCRPDLLPEKK